LAGQRWSGESAKVFPVAMGQRITAEDPGAGI